MSEQGRVLYRSPRLRVVHQPADSDVLVFTFNGGEFAYEDQAFFGSAFLAKRGLAGVGFVDLCSGWFVAEEMRRALAIVDAEVPRSGISSTLTYGISMGGWGALKFASRLRADAALAFGPQWSIDPALIGHFDQRYASMFRPELHSGMQIEQTDLCARNFIFFDPHEAADDEHARILSQFRGIERVIGPFLGHPTIQYFTENKLFREVFALAARPDTTARDFRALIRSRRAQSGRYHLGRAEYLNRVSRRGDLVLASYAKAIEFSRLPPEHKDWPAARIGYASALLRARQRDSAAAVLESLWRFGIRPVYSKHLADLLSQARAYCRARELLLAQLERQPTRPELRIDLARVYLGLAEPERARAELEAARPHAQRRVGIWRRMATVYKQLGCAAEAAEIEGIVAELGGAARESNQDRAWSAKEPRAA